MKLAEALQERADLNRKIDQLRSRMGNNALVQEGELPAEDPMALKQELDGCIERLAMLVSRINLTNCRTVAAGRTLTEMIAQKDALSLKLTVYQNLVHAASRTVDRARGSEIKIRATLPVAELQKQVDVMAKKLRLLDNRLQETNWTTELLED